MELFHGTGVRLDARLPFVHWWYDTPSHAAELTAGYFNTHARNGYLPFLKTLAHHKVGLHVTGAEQRNAEQPKECAANPEMQLRLLRAAAASMHVSGSNRLVSTTPVMCTTLHYCSALHRTCGDLLPAATAACRGCLFALQSQRRATRRY